MTDTLAPASECRLPLRVHTCLQGRTADRVSATSLAGYSMVGLTTRMRVHHEYSSNDLCTLSSIIWNELAVREI